jgi:hypothetical protein
MAFDGMGGDMGGVECMEDRCLGYGSGMYSTDDIHEERLYMRLDVHRS